MDWYEYALLSSQNACCKHHSLKSIDDIESIPSSAWCLQHDFVLCDNVDIFHKTNKRQLSVYNTLGITSVYVYNI